MSNNTSGDWLPHHHQQQQQSQRLSGNKFLFADLAEALPSPQKPPSPPGGSARPILGSGGGAVGGSGKWDLPDTPAHAWNVDVPDFVPQQWQQQQQQRKAPQQQQQPQGPHQVSDPLSCMVVQSLAALAAAGADRDATEEELNACVLRLYQLAQSRADLDRLVATAVTSAMTSGQLCEPAANLLAFLAVNFVVSEQVSPHLLATSPSLSANPVYESLLMLCSKENDATRLEIANTKSLSSERANYILLFSWLYMYLPSLQTPTQRQGALAHHALIFLGQLAALPACPAAFLTLRDALTAIGAPLEFDACDPECAQANELTKLLTELYDQLREAAASGRCGDPQVSADIIRLLELRASSWVPRDPSSAAGASAVAGASSGGPYVGGRGDMTAGGVSGSDTMTDDMYADYEQFLRESGQL